MINAEELSMTRVDPTVMLSNLAMAFNHSPFCNSMGLVMKVEDDQLKGYLDMKPGLIGNVAYQILHGGVSASVLDSIGGAVAMGELYRKAADDELTDVMKKIARLATVDMRIDYIAAGRGAFFVATAETLRLGRKGCTMRMNLHNDEGKLIATGVASYTY